MPGRSAFRTLVIAAGLAAAAALPATANASMTGCVSMTTNDGKSCVRITGSGTHVQSVNAGLKLAVRTQRHGYLRVWGSGFSFRTSNRTYWNQSYWHTQTYWSPSFTLDRNLPKGSRVCASFYEKTGTTSYRQYSPACGTIG